MRNYFIIWALFGKEAADGYREREIVSGIIMWVFILLLAGIAGACYLASILWQSVTQYLHYREKYGAEWRREFERYHGSAVHAEIRLLIVFLCLATLLVIFIRAGWQFYQLQKKHRQGYPY